MSKHIALFLKGVAMGAANVIPGVSGGTVAFITGIYERLIKALKSFDLEIIKLVAKGKFKEIATKVDLQFLVVLFAGIAVSILSFAKITEWAFEHHETLTLAFFFGLILASVFAVGRGVSAFNLKNIIALLLGIGIAIFIAFLPPAQANSSFIYVFICGLVAVCSMILPGLSGSYILILMGNYLLVLQSVSSMNFSILIPLMLGVGVGFIVFSRVLSYLFEHFRDLTIMLLTGFVAGSLLIIWPWKETIYETFKEKQKAVGYVWKLPQIDSQFFIALLLMVIGFAVVWGMEKFSKKEG